MAGHETRNGVDAGEAGHVEVDQDKVRLPLVAGEGGFEIADGGEAGHLDGIVVNAEDALDRFENQRMVVRYEQANVAEILVPAVFAGGSLHHLMPSHFVLPGVVN